MPSNVPISQGAVVIATQSDGSNVQHQEVPIEFLTSANEPLNVATTTPLPITDESQLKLLRAMLVEMRVQSEMLFNMFCTEVEPLELLREKYKSYPATL